MLEDQVAYLLQKYLGNYVRGLSKEALKISVWQGDVELTNMQLKPEALNALKLPVRVKAGFLGSVKIKVPWSRLGQDPVLVYLDRIFLLAEPETQVEGCSEDAVQEAKRSRIREMELRMLEKAEQLKSEVNKSWLGSLINTIIGNLKLSVSNIHIRYEDLESNPGHPFAAGVMLEKLSAVTVDDSGKETFVTGGALDCIQKSVELDRLSIYLDSDIIPWDLDKPWENLLPSEWVQVFRFGTKDGRPADRIVKSHTYVLQPVTGNAKYSKLRPNASADGGQPLQKAAVNLDDVTLCLSKNGYTDVLKLADNFAAFNQRLKYAHYRPPVSVKSDSRSWWKYAFKAVSDQMKKASGKLSWEQVLRYARLRKRYIALYAKLLKSDISRPVADDNEELEELDRGLDIELILQWRMLAHKFLEQSVEDSHFKKQKTKQSWWSFGWKNQSFKDESEPFQFSEEDWERLSKIIGYKEGDDEQSLMISKLDVLHTALEIHMKHNASKLLDGSLECLAELSCEGLDCAIKLYPEAKVFDMKLGSYQLSSPLGLIAESATTVDSLVGVFCYKPFDVKVDWSMVAKASPCYVTYLKDSICEVMKFFESNTAVSQTVALETAAAVQMTIDGVKRTAQEQVNRALKDHARFLLDLDIAAPKITIPTEFRPDDTHSTKLMLDLGNLVIRSQDDYERKSSKELDMYLQFDMVLSDVSAFLVDGDYHWSQKSDKSSASALKNGASFLPVIDKCGVILKLQQIRLENPSYPSTRLALRLPSLGFHFSPARYHRLMQIVKIFQEDSDKSDHVRPWENADFEGWLSLLNWKGVGNREAVWQRRYLSLVGPFLYVLESPGAKSYKQYLSLRGKQIYQVPPELVGDVDCVLAVCDASRSNNKVVEDPSALILRCDSDDSRKTWKSRLQGAKYSASGLAPITGLSETSSDSEGSETVTNENLDAFGISKIERVFITGALDELKVFVSYSRQHDQSFMKILIAKEMRLLEFRAIGSQVQLSLRENDMFIGTVLKSLEIEDLTGIRGASDEDHCYLARSFIHSSDAPLSSEDSAIESIDITHPSLSEEEKYYEAPEDLVDSKDHATKSPQTVSQYPSTQSWPQSETLSLKTPSFCRVSGLVPDDTVEDRIEEAEVLETLDSFVKAQIVIYDRNSPLYSNIDKRVIVTLATLSFFCRRPTILAILEFVNAINTEDQSSESFTDISSAASENFSGESVIDDQQLMAIEEPIVKGLLGRGKSRVIFNLKLNMARAQIVLMNEDGTKLATLSQDNLQTDIKVFPSSFSIKAALGNLRMSDESLSDSHMYFWICDMRNPGGTSFVELIFTSFSVEDEDYEGYEYSLFGQLSEVRVVYLNRFLQEVVSYFMGLVPNSSQGVVKLKDQVTNSEKWFTTSEIEGSPAVKLDLSLKKPIILMPRSTDSHDYLKLDVVQITLKNTFEWLSGSKTELNAVHLDILTILIEDINLNVGTGLEVSESIIQDVKGVSIVLRRSLRDLSHQIPSNEAAIKIDELRASLSNQEYQIISECAQSNLSETPRTVPQLNSFATSSEDVIESIGPQVPAGAESRVLDREIWTTIEVSVAINLVELCLRAGVTGDASLASVKVSGLWLLYKSNSLAEGFLSATLMDFSVMDNREGTEEEFRLAIGKPENIGYRPQKLVSDYKNQSMFHANVTEEKDINPITTMLILDAKFGENMSLLSVSLQRPQLLVALDFLLAVVEFFVPSVGNLLSNDDNKSPTHRVDAIILDQSIYSQPSSEFSLSPGRPLIADDERFDNFVYDGKGGILFLKDRQGFNLSGPSTEAIIHVGSGKKLQFKNVVIKNGLYLDSCILLGADSSYSASEEDGVYHDGGDEDLHLDHSQNSGNELQLQNTAVNRSVELIVEIQAIGPELTFYNTSKDVRESPMLSNKLLHAQLDAFSRLVMRGDTLEMTANVLGLAMESNGIRIMEPFDTSLTYSNASGKTNIHISVSDVFMNFSFSILRLFLAVEEDILAFLRMTSKKMTFVCSQFDKVGTIRNSSSDQVFAFWKPRAPPGFAVLGDYLTPLDKPPAKGVLAVNTNFARVKRPVSFRLIWPPLVSGVVSGEGISNDDSCQNSILSDGYSCCSVWFPEAPNGYVALGCVVSPGRTPPSLSSAFCISVSLVSPCSLRDCITIGSTDVCPSSLVFWRVDNSVGTFLPVDPVTSNILGRAYELRQMIFGLSEVSPKASMQSPVQGCTSNVHSAKMQESAATNSGRHFEAVASFRLIWWNRGSGSKKKLSVWRPVIPEGMVYFGDIAVKGYEPPNTCIVLHDDDELFKIPLDFQLVGQIKKQRSMENISFWLPQAPPGFVSLGCIAYKRTPKQYDLPSLRCVRSDMVTGDRFLEESVWDTYDAKLRGEPFSMWAVGNELGAFIVRNGSKRPPRRFALKLADLNVPSSSDDIVIDAEIKTFSAALFDDYGGLMVPLFNISLSGIGFSVHGRANYKNSTASFSLAARSYNDKYESWEPLVEPVDGFLRYEYDPNAPGAVSQLRVTSTRDLNLNVSVSNANMMIQAYASWNNLNLGDKYANTREVFSPANGSRSVKDVHHKRNYYIIPQNKLGQDIFFQATEIRGGSNVTRMPSGDMKPIKVPAAENMLDAHLKGKTCRNARRMVTLVILDAQFSSVEGLTLNQYTAAIRLSPNQTLSSSSTLCPQSARTRGSVSSYSSSSKLDVVNWREVFFFKVGSPDEYTMEIIVTNMGKGDPVGFYSTPLNEIAVNVEDYVYQDDYLKNITWIDLCAAESMNTSEVDKSHRPCGRMRCAVLLSPKSEAVDRDETAPGGRKSGYIQISPRMGGPWTTVRLNYAAPAACWRLGDDVVASEVVVKDGNRYVNIRSLVSVHNNTGFVLDLCLVSKASREQMRTQQQNCSIEQGGSQQADERIQIDESFETEKYDTKIGWVGIQPIQDHLEGGSSHHAVSGIELPSGWEWICDWCLDTSSVNTSDGWVYAPDVESLKWPESFDPLKFVNYARQRRWIRKRKQISDSLRREISVGLLKPGDTLPLPLSGMTQSGHFLLHLRPSNNDGSDQFSWSSAVDKTGHLEDSGRPEGSSEICVSSLKVSEELLYCNQISGTSSSGSHKLWFCVSVQASEIAKDIRSDPIHDWSIVVKAPLSITNYLPLTSEYSILEMQSNGHFVACSRGIITPAKAVRVHNADIRNPLFLSLLPQKGWLPIQEAVCISHPQGVPAKTISLRSSISGRIVQLILEQNYDKEQQMLEKVIRVYAPYWFDISRCPPINFRLLDTGKKHTQIKFPFRSRNISEVVSEDITEEEIYEGHTIASALNFNLLGLSASISEAGNDHFGPIKDLSPLGDMDGSLDLCAYDADAKCMRLFISTKACPYQSVPTKVLCIRPFMTFTNRVGQDIFIRLNGEDNLKVLHASDSRVSFICREAAGAHKLQVRLEDTTWSYPVQILKEDTFSLVLRRHDGTRRFVRTEVRGYEEGSRFIVVFRLGSSNGLIRIENRTSGKKISIRQSGFGEDAWIQLEPLSTSTFCWEDPYGQKFIDTKINGHDRIGVWRLDLERTGFYSAEGEQGLHFHVLEMGAIMVARFTEDSTSNADGEIRSLTLGNWGSPHMESGTQHSSSPIELLVELGVVGLSVIDHRPKELCYLYLERVFMAYSTGYDSGATSRFKLILGDFQIDNQLPLTLMPVLLAPEQANDMHHPVFKMTITIRNDKPDGIQVYPYVYIRVTDKVWRLDIHEPIIWAFVDFYSNLQLNRLPESASVSQVDPEIRIDLIDVSEVRLKLSLETAPSQRPHGVLGVWSPILSAVGNAFKIQVHLRRVMHRDRFMRKSSIVPAIGNRIWRDLIHNPLHLLFSVDVLGMTSSTLASLSKGFAELSTDGQFMQLRSKQVSSRRITGVGDGLFQGTEALAQGFAFGVSGVVRKPMESARQNGVLGLAHGLGRAFLGFVVQPMSGALDFFSMTVDGIGASCSKCLEVLNNKTTSQRIRNPRAIHADGILREYCEKEAVGQMILYLAEASRHFGCTEIFKEPSKFAWSDFYEQHFLVPNQRIVMVTNKRVMLLQCPAPDKMDRKPCKIMWDVPWEELMTVELAKAGCQQPSHLILHLKNFRRSENFVQVIKCNVGEMDESEPQAVRICSVVQKMWKAYQSNVKSLTLKVPSSQRHVYFSWTEADERETRMPSKVIFNSREFSSFSSISDEMRFVKHAFNFSKIWTSEQESKSSCTLCKKQISQDTEICSIWRPNCPEGYVAIGDIARVGIHPPNVAAVYHNIDGQFALPVGYDLVWRNCVDDYTTPVSIWHPRAPEGFVSPGCVAVASYEEPELNLVHCAAESVVEETTFEDHKIWSAPGSYPWACHVYQVRSEALHFSALRQIREESDWKPIRVIDDGQLPPKSDQ